MCSSIQGICSLIWQEDNLIIWKYVIVVNAVEKMHMEILEYL